MRIVATLSNFTITYPHLPVLILDTAKHGEAEVEGTNDAEAAV